ESFACAWRLIRSMFGFSGESVKILTTTSIATVLLVYGLIMLAHWIMRHTTHEALVEDTPWWLVSIIWAFMIVAIVIAQGGGDAFIYFQFCANSQDPHGSAAAVGARAGGWCRRGGCDAGWLGDDRARGGLCAEHSRHARPVGHVARPGEEARR